MKFICKFMANKCNGQIYCVKKYKKSRVKSGKNFLENFFKKRRLKIN